MVPPPMVQLKQLTILQLLLTDKYKRVDSLRENPVYESQPFTKEEEEMFSGTLKDGRNENESAPPEVDNEPIKSQEQEPPKQLELFEERLLAPESRSRHRLIGQLFDTYWLVQFEDNFYTLTSMLPMKKYIMSDS